MQRTEHKVVQKETMIRLGNPFDDPQVGSCGPGSGLSPG
jgi:hypothetical protein